MRWTLDDYIVMGRGMFAALKLTARFATWALLWAALAYVAWRFAFPPT